MRINKFKSWIFWHVVILVFSFLNITFRSALQWITSGPHECKLHSWWPTQLPSHLARLNIHNWMTHSWQFTDSIQPLKAPMTGKSPPTQIESSILMAYLSCTKWQITKSKCFNNLALSGGLSHTHILEGLRSRSFEQCPHCASSRSRPLKSGPKSPLFLWEILWINTENMQELTCRNRPCVKGKLFRANTGKMFGF